MAQPLGTHSRLHLETLEDRLVPSTMAGVYGDGTWRYDTTAGWAHISNLQANFLDVDDAGDVYASFQDRKPTDGLWRWSASTANWQKLSNLNVQQMQLTASGIFYGDFEDGLWRWDPSAGWMKLTALRSTLMAVSDSDAFFGRYDTGSVGTWRWTPAAGWFLLTSSIPNEPQTDAAGNFYGVYTGAGQKGTWRWSPTSGWARLSSDTPFSLAVSQQGAIYECRLNTGIWYAAPGTTSFTQIDSNPQIANLFALPDGTLYAQQLYLGTTGWHWSPHLLGHGFVKILYSPLDNSFTPVIGKDGDLFFQDTLNFVTGHWSLTSAYHPLGKFPVYLASQR
jgi:hypothetical protein